MTTERLHEFYILSELLNYSKAAESLYITQSILSRHIKEMEQELGVLLFERNTHTVTLTDDGQYFLKSIRPLLIQSGKALARLHTDTIAVTGNIRINCSETVLNTVLLDFIHRFKDHHRNIHMDFSLVSMNTAPEDLLSADITLSFYDFNSILPNNIKSAYLLSQVSLLAIPPFHHMGDYQEIHLSDLQGENLLIPYAEDAFGPFMKYAVLASKKCGKHLGEIAVASPDEALLRVELGHGVMMLPHHMRHRAYPHTRTIRISNHECKFPVYIYLNQNAENSAAKIFFDQIMSLTPLHTT